MKPFLILKTGSTMPHIAAQFGDFEHWFANAMGLSLDSTQAHVFNAELGELPTNYDYAGIVITGSPAMVSERLTWSENAAAWLLQAHTANIPMLGVCYGHQLLAHALGGTVGPNPKGRQIGTARLDFSSAGMDDPITSTLSTIPYAQVTHQESVLSIPAGSQILVSTELDPHHALYHGNRTWGLQFHPEFSAEVTRTYIDARKDAINNEGLNAQQLAASVQDTPHTYSLLQRFRHFCECAEAEARAAS